MKVKRSQLAHYMLSFKGEASTQLNRLVVSFHSCGGLFKNRGHFNILALLVLSF
jgi:hypothetical protein